ncbi:hypothetical protein AB0H24_26640 [Streptomyces globisporus]|uniref:hypothetical protein n=1 Tax=Streptomyces globisporus TaxID=1908 RepID=UPI0005CA7CE7|nr:hypothetical protein [Streptomyces globisporus]AWL87797.1 hypothetical protein DIJ69_19340 [Streptomyces globisporus]PPA41663.1 hypothetical protein BF14_019350 [Streptomyces griseus]RAN18981.1 hypothetical protein A3838_18860 [Streptomyces badius]RAN26887.1 hypothetical protein A3800_18870 [Streptomyces badius]
MGDVLLALSIPVLVFGGGIYAACDCWWRRRHPAPPSPYTHRAARLAEQDMLLLAEEIVDGAYAAFGPFYDAPEPGPAEPPTEPAALSSRSPRPSRPASTPDRAPSPPAAVQKP